MAIFKCGGQWVLDDYGNRACEYEAEATWRGHRCPGCGRYYDVRRVGAVAAKQKRMTAEDLMALPPTEYIPTGVPDFDRVIGGGLVRGNVILFGGEKGTGKSTLLSMVAAGIASPRRKVLYAMAETGSRGFAPIFQRTLKERGADLKSIEVMPDAIDGYAIKERVEEMDAFLFIVDALQVVTLSDIGGNEGSIAQCDGVMNLLQALCCDEKKPRCAIIINHLVKGGDFAGSETTQHLADTLLMFNYEVDYDEESDVLEDRRYRTLSIAQKNRAGSTRETARFEMSDAGVLIPAPKSKLLRLDDAREEVKPSRFAKKDPPKLYPVE
jgi:DNA repair protein RadA/Sms